MAADRLLSLVSCLTAGGALQLVKLVKLVKYKRIYKPPCPGEKFVIGVNAATKRPLQNNKRGSSEKQAARGLRAQQQIKRPAR
jgi:hypothetical protein